MCPFGRLLFCLMTGDLDRVLGGWVGWGGRRLGGRRLGGRAGVGWVGGLGWVGGPRLGGRA